jgi:hypothetical protein
MRFRHKNRTRKLRPLPPMPDDGMVMLRGYIVEPERAHWNGVDHLEGFDELPKALRDLINYAETPEAGAYPTRHLVGPDGPFYRFNIKKDAHARAREAARKFLTDAS